MENQVYLFVYAYFRRVLGLFFGVYWSLFVIEKTPRHSSNDDFAKHRRFGDLVLRYSEFAKI